MADRLYLSYWLRGFSTMNMARHFEKLLANFPFSPDNPANTALRVQHIDSNEPPVVEHVFADPLDIVEVGNVIRPGISTDCCVELEAWWGLWQYQNDWVLRPAPVRLFLFGPEFEGYELADGTREQIRIEFGLESHFLVQPHLPHSPYYAQSNLKGLLQLSHSLDEVLAVEKRRLWAESGENFAERFKSVLQ